MSLIEEALYSRLQAVNGVTNLVSTRVYANAVPQNVTYPCVSYQHIASPRDYAMGGQTGLVDARVQVNSWAESYSGVKAVAEQIRLALSGWSGTAKSVTVDVVWHYGDQDIYDPMEQTATPVFGIATDYGITYREAVPT